MSDHEGNESETELSMKTEGSSLYGDKEKMVDNEDSQQNMSEILGRPGH